MITNDIFLITTGFNQANEDSEQDLSFWIELTSKARLVYAQQLQLPTEWMHVADIIVADG